MLSRAALEGCRSNPFTQPIPKARAAAPAVGPCGLPQPRRHSGAPARLLGIGLASSASTLKPAAVEPVRGTQDSFSLDDLAQASAKPRRNIGEFLASNDQASMNRGTSRVRQSQAFIDLDELCA